MYTCVYVSSPLSYFMPCLLYCDCTKDIFLYDVVILNLPFWFDEWILHFYCRFTSNIIISQLRQHIWKSNLGSQGPDSLTSCSHKRWGILPLLQMYISIHFYWCKPVRILKIKGVIAKQVFSSFQFSFLIVFLIHSKLPSRPPFDFFWSLYSKWFEDKYPANLHFFCHMPSSLFLPEKNSPPFMSFSVIHSNSHFSFFLVAVRDIWILSQSLFLLPPPSVFLPSRRNCRNFYIFLLQKKEPKNFLCKCAHMPKRFMCIIVNEIIVNFFTAVVTLFLLFR